jgi:thiamine transport system permease protein
VAAPLNLRSARDTRRPLRTAQHRLAAGLLVGGLILLLVLPLAALAVRSVARLDAERGQSGPVQRGFTLAYYQELNQNRRNNLFYVPPTAAIGNSLAAAGATVAGVGAGLPAAWAVAALAPISKKRWDATSAGLALDALLLLPLGTSAVTLGLGFIVALDTPPLDLRASPILLPLAHTLVALPFVVRSLVPALRSIRPRRQARRRWGPTWRRCGAR